MNRQCKCSLNAVMHAWKRIKSPVQSCRKHNNVTVYAAGARNRNEPTDRITLFNNNISPLPDKVTLKDVGKRDAREMCPSQYFNTD